MKPRTISPKDRIPIIVAIIGLVAVIVSAIISISPELLVKSASPTTTFTPVIAATSTAILSSSSYDDPSGVFNISYPSGFFVVSREVTDSRLRVIFIPFEAKNYDIEFISVDTGLSNGVIFSSDAAIQNIIYTPAADSIRFVISNKITENWYYLIYKETSNTKINYFHDFVEVDKDTFAVVFISVNTINMDEKATSIQVENIISNFNWHPDKIHQLFP